MLFDELFALHEHARRAATRIVDTPLVRREHLDQHADHASRRVTFFCACVGRVIRPATCIRLSPPVRVNTTSTVPASRPRTSINFAKNRFVFGEQSSVRGSELDSVSLRYSPRSLRCRDLSNRMVRRQRAETSSRLPAAGQDYPSAQRMM